MRSKWARSGWVAIALAGATGLTACSQAASPSSSSPSAGASATAAATTTSGASGGTVLGSLGITGPLPAKLKGLKIALVRQLSAGDFFEQWLVGAQAEAKALGIDLLVYSGNGNDAQQALYLQQAINEHVAAIIIDHGFAQTIDPVAAKAAAAHIPIVAFDVSTGVKSAITLNQDDKVVAAQSLSVLKADTGGKAQVIYAYVAGYLPLDLRNEEWEAFKKANPGIQQVAQVGVVNNDTTPQTADEIKAALLAHPDVTAIFAPYDAFAQGAVLAVDELGLQGKVKVYGGDISTADIDAMTAANSPWVDTSATNPANVGEVAVRTASLLALGDKVPSLVQVPPVLITQSFLRSHDISNMAQLVTAIPTMNTPSLVPVP